MGGPDHVAFSALYRTHARDVYRFALFLSGNASWADDLVSETFVRAWHARSRLDLATVKGYLFTIARNLYLHQIRDARPTQPIDDLVCDPAPDPLRRIDARRDLDAVLAALQTLPEIDRAALLMRADEELPYEEIAQALGITMSAAKVKVHRARLKLAEARRARESSTEKAGDSWT